MPTPEEEKARLRYLELKAKQGAVSAENKAESGETAAPEEPSLMSKLALALATRGHSGGWDPALNTSIEKNAIEPAQEGGRRAMRYGSGMVDLGATTLAKPIATTLQKGRLPRNLTDALTNYLPSAKAGENAAQGKPYTNSELWKNELKLPAGGQVSDIPYVGDMVDKDGPADFTTRGTAAELTSLATDPANQLAKLVAPVSSLLDKGGRAAYRNGFRSVSAAPLKFKNASAIGEHALPDLAYDEDIFKAGSSPWEMVDQLKNYLKEKIGPQYNAILDHPDVAAKRATIGQTLDRTKQTVADEIRASSFGTDATKQFGNRLAKDVGTDRRYFPDGRAPRDLITRAKGYSAAARGKIGATGDIMKEGVEKPLKQMLMDFAQDQRSKAAELAEEALPGSRDVIRGLNEKYAVAKPAIEPLEALAQREMKKYPLTQVKSGLFAHGFDAAKAALGMIGGKYVNSPQGAVRIGNTLKALSKTPAWDNLLRREGLGTTSSEDEQ